MQSYSKPRSRYRHRPQIFGVLETHLDGPYAQDGPWDFGAKAQGNAFHGLNLYDQLIGMQFVRRRIPEKHEWNSFKLNGDFSVTFRQALASSQIKGTPATANCLC